MNELLERISDELDSGTELLDSAEPELSSELEDSLDEELNTAEELLNSAELLDNFSDELDFAELDIAADELLKATELKPGSVAELPGVSLELELFMSPIFPAQAGSFLQASIAELIKLA